MAAYFHSVTLDEDKCRGCTNCIKRCPTEAIRVRKSKARIINERCIDCGECIRVCPYHAKKAITDSKSDLQFYKYKIALPAPSLYSQFSPKYSRAEILTALKTIGFDDVFEVAAGAEIVTEATKRLLKEKKPGKTLISSACPAVVRLIQVRFPNLIDNLVKLKSPMEISAEIAKNKVAAATNLKNDEIGVFFITPCAAKVTSVKAPIEKPESFVDRAIAIKDIYIDIVRALENLTFHKELESAGYKGIRWSDSGGEGLALEIDEYLAVDGIHNVIKILERIESDRLSDVKFVEVLACTGGCLGGPLTVENAYVARTRLKKHVKDAKEKNIQPHIINDYKEIVWSQSIEHKPIMKLDKDIVSAIRKLEELEAINEDFPSLDCGACGAPSCRALAEDIVRGNANETDCIFKLREKVRKLAGQMMELEAKMPPVMDKGGENES